MMIGQQNLQSRIEQLVDNNTFPRFSILVGPKGSGKKTFAPYIAGYMRSGWVHAFDVKIDTIREVIANAYKVADTTVYFIPDTDNMSNAARNALLKVTEEPPNNAFFIMTLEDENNTLETIRSRATIFHMDRYTPGEIGSYFYDKYHANHGKDDEIIVTSLCETPGEVDLLVKMGIKEFYDYVQLVIDNIAEVSLANAFKIANKIALKDDSDGYDLRMFWKAFNIVCLKKSLMFDAAEKSMICYGKSVLCTSTYLNKLKTSGINKQMLFDNWVLEIRDLWQSL